MKAIMLYLLLCLPVLAIAQGKQKAEKDFVAELNNIIKNSSQQHWAFEGEKMKIDTAFAISRDGILSVTVSYTNDSSVVRTKMEAPVNKISRVAYDLYLILEFDDDDVSNSYAEGKENAVFISNENSRLFHIGAPLPEDMQRQVKLQKLLDNLLKYYKN